MRYKVSSSHLIDVNRIALSKHRCRSSALREIIEAVDGISYEGLELEEVNIPGYPGLYQVSWGRYGHRGRTRRRVGWLQELEGIP